MFVLLWIFDDVLLVYDVKMVFVCGDWSVIFVLGGWYGWILNFDDEWNVVQGQFRWWLWDLFCCDGLVLWI